LEKELKSRSVTENANLKRQTKAFLGKEKMLETRLHNANEDTQTALDALQEMVSYSSKQLLYFQLSEKEKGKWEQKLKLLHG